jgi:hypothetical protein
MRDSGLRGVRSRKESIDPCQGLWPVGILGSGMCRFPGAAADMMDSSALQSPPARRVERSGESTATFTDARQHVKIQAL